MSIEAPERTLTVPAEWYDLLVKILDRTHLLAIDPGKYGFAVAPIGRGEYVRISPETPAIPQGS